MGLNDALHNGQAQTTASDAVAPTSIEPLKDVGLVLRLNTKSTIPHPQPHRVPPSLRTDFYLPARRRELEGIVQEIGQRQLSPRPVTTEFQRGNR